MIYRAHSEMAWPATPRRDEVTVPHFDSDQFERVLDMVLEGSEEPPHDHCCERMALAVRFECHECGDVYQCPDSLIRYAAVFDEYGLIVHDGTTSYVLIDHCPWCGAQLPASKRELWFETLQSMGIESPFEQSIPPEFRSSAWYRQH